MMKKFDVVVTNDCGCEIARKSCEYDDERYTGFTLGFLMYECNMDYCEFEVGDTIKFEEVE